MSKALRSRAGRGFSLLEMMIALALTAMVYGLVTYTMQQISHVVRDSEKKMTSKRVLINVAERIRWQLRCAYVSTTADASQRPSSNTRPGTLAAGLYGTKGDESERDVLLFRTTLPKSGRGGTVEVGYTIMQRNRKEPPYLVYREYPWVDPLGLHTDDDDPNAPWEVYCKEIKGITFEYSTNGEIWQQQWTQADLPLWVRITLLPYEGEPVVTVAGIGMVAPRW